MIGKRIRCVRIEEDKIGSSQEMQRRSGDSQYGEVGRLILNGESLLAFGQLVDCKVALSLLGLSVSRVAQSAATVHPGLNS